MSDGGKYLQSELTHEVFRIASNSIEVHELAKKGWLRPVDLVKPQLLDQLFSISLSLFDQSSKAAAR